MNKKERFLTAVQGGIPDVVPVAPLIHDRFAYKVLGKSGWRAVFETHKIIGSTFFRGPLPVAFDVSWGGGYGEGTWLLERTGKRVVREHVIKTPMGNLTSKIASGMIPQDPLVSRIVEYFIKTEKDYKVYKDYLEEWLRRVKPDFTDAAEAHETMGDDGVPSVGISGAFNHLGSVRGMQELLVDLYRRPELVRDLMEALLLVKEKQIEAFNESPSEVLYYDACWAFDMSPGLFKKWVFPDLQRAVKLVRARESKYIGFYLLGKMRAIMPLIVETRPHYVETFETQGGDLPLREAKRKYGKQVCIMGNYNILTLVQGTVEDAKRETLRCLEEGMEGGGYVLVTGDEVPTDAKIENLKMMVKTVEEHGRY